VRNLQAGGKPAHDEIKGWWENINKDATNPRGGV